LLLAISRPTGYIARMANRTATKDKRRRTTQVPVTTMEDVPVLSAKERAELLTSLEQAQARAKAGKAVDYDPNTFKDRLVDIYRGVKR
jgi:hypothetical protein